VPGSGP